MNDNQSTENETNQTFSWENKKDNESHTEPLSLDELQEVMAEIRY